MTAAYGLPDDAFERVEGVPMSKMEVRAVALAKLRLRPDSRVLDVGCGTGAVTCDAALLAGSVVALDSSADAVSATRLNAERLGLDNVTVVEGRAPDALAGLGRFDAAFVGGTTGALGEIVSALAGLLVPGGRVVVNTVGMRSTNASLEALRSAPWAGWESVQVSVSRAEILGGDVRFVPLNPVWVTSASLEGGA